MKIIDAHMHYFATPGFQKVAQQAGHVNTAECWQEICEDNNIVFAVAMGNSEGATAHFGGVVPRVVNLQAPFTEESYNQPANVGYCLGVDGALLTLENAERTAQEFEVYLQKPECLGIKFYPGYYPCYMEDRRNWPLFELAEAYQVPVAIHTGDTAGTGSHARLKYAHPLTVDDVAAQFPRNKFVICHCGNPWIMDATEVAAKNENVYLDLSGLLEGSPDAAFFEYNQGYFQYVQTWLRYLGRWEKVLYGSDWPLINIPSYIALMQRLVPEKHWEGFFYGNALTVYSKINNLLK